jgi:plasmid stability protein
MRRTQLYLDDDLWHALHVRAQRLGTSISNLVRQAARERYLGKLDERRDAMQALVGVRKDRSELPDSTEYVRGLRRGTRTERFGKQSLGKQ